MRGPVNSPHLIYILRSHQRLYNICVSIHAQVTPNECVTVPEGLCSAYFLTHLIVFSQHRFILYAFITLKVPELVVYNTLYCIQYKCLSIVQFMSGRWTRRLPRYWRHCSFPCLYPFSFLKCLLLLAYRIRAYSSAESTPWAICCVLPQSNYPGSLQHISLPLIVNPLWL